MRRLNIPIDKPSIGMESAGEVSRKRFLRVLVSMNRTLLLAVAAVAGSLLIPPSDGLLWGDLLRGLVGTALVLAVGFQYFWTARTLESVDRNREVLGEAFLAPPQMTQLLPAFRETMRVSYGSLLRDYKLSAPELQPLLANLDKDDSTVVSRLSALVSLRKRLEQTFEDPEAARHWLQTTNPYLHPATPEDLLAKGEIERVESALEALDSGIFV